MIYYKDKVNNEIYEVNDIHRSDDAFYYVFGNEFLPTFEDMYFSSSKIIEFIDEEYGFLKYRFDIRYNFINYETTLIPSWNKDVPLMGHQLNLMSQNFISSDSAEDLYYLIYKNICEIDQKLSKYYVKLKDFKFSNTDIFEILDENSQEVKDFKVRNYFK